MSQPSGFVHNKVVLVTGAGGGIGRDFALALAREGAKVVVNDLGASLQGEGRDTARAQAVVDEIQAAGGQAVANGDSVADWDGANRMVTQAVDTFGRIDAVINNAGILRDRFFFNMSPEEWRAVIDVHLNGAFYVSRAAAPHFKEQQSGSYIHMVSTSGLVGNFGQANYAAAKLGISAQRCGGRCDRADFCRASERNLPDEPKPPAALAAHRARVDTAIRGRPGDSGVAIEFLQTRPLARRVRLGPGVSPGSARRMSCRLGRRHRHDQEAVYGTD